MCGIFGMVEFGHRRWSTDERAGLLTAMGRSLHHRGPDDAGTWHWSDDRAAVAIGFRRLSIMDPAGGRQPMFNEDGTVAVICNGELYNHRELRDELRAKGHRFRSGSDSEVLVHLYEEDGWHGVARLRGMFAFAIWDSRARQLVLGRDRLGIKPVLVHQDRDRLVFGSELSALLPALEDAPPISTESLLKLLVLKYVPGPATALERIHKVMPGTVMVVSESGIVTHRYWSVPSAAADDQIDAASAATRIARMLHESVRMHLMSDVPVGAFLSGGLDSTAVVALMQAAAGGQPLHTFAIGFEGQPAYSELQEARQSAASFRTIHHELVCRPDHVPTVLPSLVAHLEEPLSDPAILPTYLLSTRAAQHVKVVLTGEGADELFGGYRRYAFDRFAPVYRWLPAGLRRQVASRLAGAGVGRRVRQALEALGGQSPVHRHLHWVGTFLPDELDAVVADPMAARHTFEGLAETWRPFFDDRADTAAMLQADLATWLPDDLLAKVDRASMAASLEARVPYLDHPLVELVAALPASLQIHRGVGKALLRAAVSELVPPRTLARRKQGLDLPLAAWLRGPLKSYLTDIVTLEGPGGLFNERGVGRYVDEHLSGVQDRSRQLWTVLMIKLWCQTMRDRRPEPLRVGVQ